MSSVCAAVTHQKMLADLCVAFGGRLAEELIGGHDKVTTGAMSDIEMATRMARAMVSAWATAMKLIEAKIRHAVSLA